MIATTAKSAFVTLATLATFVIAAPAAQAHPLSPSLLRLDALGDGVFDVTLRSPAKVTPPAIAPAGCQVEALGTAYEADARLVRERWRCTPEAAVALTADPGQSPVVVELADRDALSTFVLDADHANMPISAAASTAATFGTWTGLGMLHLAGGLDHVLIVLGLSALIGFRARLIPALTAFTAGHSLSLALAATGVVTLPSTPVEVAIAATLVILGLELVTRRRPDESDKFAAAAGPIGRHPWLGGTAVGLIHGLGFAGALHDLGLPANHLATSLLGFNLGLELAQLALVTMAFGAAWSIGRALSATARPVVAASAARATGWVVGISGAAWMIDRAVL